MGIAAAGNEVIVVNLDRDTISAVPVGGGRPRVVYQGKTSIRVAADLTGIVFWKALARDAYDLVHVRTGGAQPDVLVPHQRFPGPLALDAASVYFDGGSGIVRVPRGGGTPQAITDEVAREIALDGGTLYFTTEGGKLEQVPARGGTPSVVTTFDPHFVPRLAVDEGCLYYAAKGRLMKVQKP